MTLAFYSLTSMQAPRATGGLPAFALPGHPPCLPSTPPQVSPTCKVLRKSCLLQGTQQLLRCPWSALSSDIYMIAPKHPPLTVVCEYTIHSYFRFPGHSCLQVPSTPILPFLVPVVSNLKAEIFTNASPRDPWSLGQCNLHHQPQDLVERENSEAQGLCLLGEEKMSKKQRESISAWGIF